MIFHQALFHQELLLTLFSEFFHFKAWQRGIVEAGKKGGIKSQVHQISLNIFCFENGDRFRELIKKSKEGLGGRGFSLSCFMERY